MTGSPAFPKAGLFAVPISTQERQGFIKTDMRRQMNEKAA
jgi:hypothetical protein